MVGTPFYHGTIKKAVTVFGTLFNNINIEREASNGEITTIKVPIHYAQKDKFRQRYLSTQAQTYNSAEVQVTAPRLAFENTGISYDATRKLNSLQKIVTVSADENTHKRQFMRVPYTLDFSLYLFVGKAEDGYKIIEQIVPYFTPDLTVSVNDVLPYDMPIVLVDFSAEDGWEGDMDARRRIEWTFNFSLHTYFYGLQTEEKKITKAITHSYSEQDLESDISYQDGVPVIDETPAATSTTTEDGTTMSYRIDG